MQNVVLIANKKHSRSIQHIHGKSDFADLFQNNGNLDDEFLRNVKSKVVEFENEQRNIIGDNNHDNTDIDEIL